MVALWCGHFSGVAIEDFLKFFVFDKAGVFVAMIRQRQVTCKSADDNPTIIRSQRGAQMAPDRSGS